MADDSPSLETGSIFGLTPGDTAVVDAEIARISGLGLGTVTLDTGWYSVEPQPQVGGGEDCYGGRSYRVLWWRDVRLSFWRVGDEVALWSWSVGNRDVMHYGSSEPDAQPVAPASDLTTSEGALVGGPTSALDASRLLPAIPTQNGVSAQQFQTSDSNAAVYVGIIDGTIIGYGAQLTFC